MSYNILEIDEVQGIDEIQETVRINEIDVI